MKNLIRVLIASAVLTAGFTTAQAKPEEVKLEEALSLFKHAGQSAEFFHHCYAYAIFPTVGEGAFVVGGAGGKGYVYLHDHLAQDRIIGESKLAQVSVGFQAGGKAYSEIIFFENKPALEQFESGSFEFGADASVTAITANAEVGAATNGEQAGVSGGEKDARTVGHYYKGMAVFTVAKGGLMYQAAIAGQHFSFKPLSSTAENRP